MVVAKERVNEVCCPRSFINITGNKKKLMSQIFASIEKIDFSSLDYIEPFFGSGGAYCSLPVKFNSYTCSDIFPYVIDFINQQYDINTLSDFYDWVNLKWDIKNIKSDYYNFRNYWNNNQRQNEKLRLIGFIILTNSCINAMMRFGPNGFNQSFGGRIISKEKLLGTPSLIKDHTIFKICDFREIAPHEKHFFYLDPPYTETNVMNKMWGFYEWNHSNDEDLIDLVFQQNDAKGYFVLSTIFGSFLHQKLSQFKIYNIEKKYKVTPWKMKAKDHKEIIITNV